MKLTATLDLLYNMKESGIVLPEELANEFRFYSKGSAKRVEFQNSTVSLEFLDEIRQYLLAHPEEPDTKGLKIQLSILSNLTSGLEKTIIRKLNILEEALVQYIGKDVINYWIYRIDAFGNPHPYLVTHIVYSEAREDRPAQTCMKICAVRHGNMTTDTLTWYSSDMGDTVSALLEEKGYYKENMDLTARYEHALDLYKEYQPQFGSQFSANGEAFDSRSSWGATMALTRDGQNTKMVNDEDAKKSKATASVVDNTSWSRRGGLSDICEEKQKYYAPVHPYIYMFHLEVHSHFWVHVCNISPYIYDKSLREKLILPEDVTDLIDVLTSDMDVLMDDIIAGKTGGTIILAKGNPGTGKTLTAEVYSEVVERPLYKVQSSQLGIGPIELEKNLKEILQRASRWGAVLLIDEADVYIRERGEDIVQNAVVGVFLRILEYYSGLLFLTTNRDKIIDDAIVSRCTATLEYLTPTPGAAHQIWIVLAKQFEIVLPIKTIDALCIEYPNISGRSIKNMLKLTSKYCRKHEIPLSLEAFKKMSKYLQVEK